MGKPAIYHSPTGHEDYLVLVEPGIWQGYATFRMLSGDTLFAGPIEAMEFGPAAIAAHVAHALEQLDA